MKDRPIIFNAPMVKAILAGKKTQTRRSVKAVGNDGRFLLQHHVSNGWWPCRSDNNETPHACPYGQPVDRLWVREAWARDEEDGALFYRADLGQGGGADDWELNRLYGVPRFRWRPSIHMPRWASRIALEITGVRVERLQDISQADAIAEGVGSLPIEARRATSKLDYMALWESINGPGSWDANPWVWVIEFKKLEGGEA